MLGYSSADPIWNGVVFGLAIAALALARMCGAPGLRFVSVAHIAIGAWLVVAAFTITVSTAAFVNHIASGAAVLLLDGFASLFPSQEAL